MTNRVRKMGGFLSLVILFAGILLFPLGGELSKFTLSELLFHLHVPMKGANYSVVWDVLKRCLRLPAVIIMIVGTFLVIPIRSNITIRISGKLVKRPISLKPLRAFRNGFLGISICVLAAGMIYFCDKVNVIQYWAQQANETSLYEQEYVDPAEQEFKYPQKKRNLVFIYLESMESTYADPSSGGEWEYNLIPNLTMLACDNISFGGEMGGGIGAMLPANGAEWTMGALVGATTGLPLKVPIDGNSYGEYSSLLPGAVTINDLLKNAGYNQVLMIGSDGAFGGRDDYFEQHGDVFVFDINEAKRQGILKDDYDNGFWGVEDEKLYDYAKDELLRLSSEDEPFNLTLLTVDTHFFDGYICTQCDTQWNTQYENVISCADRQLINFIDWIKEQSFYSNTSIVIIGDHLSMDDGFFERHSIPKDQRTIYNCFINPSVQPIIDGKSRALTIYDIFPSTVAALGITWDSDRLGLGVNLFSGEETLPERVGIQNFNAALGKSSHFYDKKFIYP